MMLRSVRFYREQVEGSPIWLAIYSDLMTNLMLFFLLMFGLTQLPDEMRAKITEGIQDNFRTSVDTQRVKQVIKRFREEESVFQINKVIEETEMQGFTKVAINEERIKLTLRSPVLFSPGQAALDPAARRLIAELARVLVGLPNRIVIEGHTDDRPIRSGQYRDNWELSLARALSVQRELEREGVNPALTAIAGCGHHAPLYPNATRLGRAFNRRIEINVIR